MATEEERCAEARTFERIDDAFRKGDLDTLRAAVGDPALVPNGRMPDTIGPCLIYAIYHSPLGFIRTLLELFADPNAPVDDGFPPLIAALSCTREVLPGATRRTDVDDVLRCCCHLAPIRISAGSMTTRRFTWPSPSAIRWRSTDHHVARVHHAEGVAGRLGQARDALRHHRAAMGSRDRNPARDAQGP